MRCRSEGTFLVPSERIDPCAGMRAQYWRRGAGDLGPLACRRMAKPQHCRVQEITQIARERTAILCRNATGKIERVADERISGGGEVNPDLVRPPRCDSHFEQRAGIPPLQDFDLTVRGFACDGRGVNRP